MSTSLCRSRRLAVALALGLAWGCGAERSSEGSAVRSDDAPAVGASVRDLLEAGQFAEAEARLDALDPESLAPGAWRRLHAVARAGQGDAGPVLAALAEPVDGDEPRRVELVLECAVPLAWVDYRLLATVMDAACARWPEQAESLRRCVAGVGDDTLFWRDPPWSDDRRPSYSVFNCRFD